MKTRNKTKISKAKKQTKKRELTARKAAWSDVLTKQQIFEHIKPILLSIAAIERQLGALINAKE